MSTIQQARFNLAHATWALRCLMDHAEALEPSQIERNLDVGPGGLRVNLAHTIEVMFFFADNFAGVEYVERTSFQADSLSMAGLRRLLDAASAELRAAVLSACERGLDGAIKWPNAPGGTLPGCAAFAQVFDHSTLHRTQAINLLKRLGVRPAPDLDPMTFQATGLPW